MKTLLILYVIIGVLNTIFMACREEPYMVRSIALYVVVMIGLTILWLPIYMLSILQFITELNEYDEDDEDEER